jgi:hypothetical protein
MREVTRGRVPVLARGDRTRLAFLTSTHVVDDLYQGAGLPTALATTAVFPAVACLLTLLLRDPRPRRY